MRAFSPLAALSLVAGVLLLAAGQARAAGESLLVVEVDSGKVLQAENATYPWYPASVTKLMTTYVTLQAVRAGRLGFDTLLTVSPNAVAEPPTKMGFGTGTQLTVDNALKMMLVRSANDIAVVLAEGVSGSIDAFAAEMNAASQRLGMTQSHWVNPNGLPDERQVTSARDMAILARALLKEFPDYQGYFDIPAIKIGKRVIRNTNSLLVRYPGTDGMKTGFICSSGFNVVATATRDNRRLIAVVFGAPSSEARAARAAYLFETSFANAGLAWLKPAQGTVDQLVPVEAAPPDLREEMCGKHRRRPAAEDVDEEIAEAMKEKGNGVSALLFAAPAGLEIKPSSLLGPMIAAKPIRVYVGPAKPEAAVASTGRPNVAKPDPVAAVIEGTKPAAGTGVLALPGRMPTAGAVPVPQPRPGAHKPTRKAKADGGHAAKSGTRHKSSAKSESKSKAQTKPEAKPETKPAVANAARPTTRPQ
ncbi:D-alanyl-D-alanine carboxypeptidase [Rhodovulum sp. PH10]|uniref:serine hydrolase n=1 Tax=Rhodovulum sp. PH10 TaxID=1187851 RepID=UPI00027C29AE|nr:serine hydrolase [Rhodovulum sp. PH10]EJW13298.1 D-alanyl-D-alanine carboxypeptidase [Rhodovulum sp. PH10]